MEKPNKSTEVVPIADLDTFVRLITVWHESKVAILEHTMTIPSGTEMRINTGEDTEDIVLVLKDEVLAAFLQGISIALIELGTLPFKQMPSPIEKENADIPLH